MRVLHLQWQLHGRPWRQQLPLFKSSLVIILIYVFNFYEVIVELQLKLNFIQQYMKILYLNRNYCRQFLLSLFRVVPHPLTININKKKKKQIIFIYLKMNGV